MRLPYQTDKPSSEALKLAEKIASLVIDSEVTYQDAMDALAETASLLTKKTKPVKIQS